jgi:hypothetical protein
MYSRKQTEGVTGIGELVNNNKKGKVKGETK